jgi:hypothetical protein
MTPETQPITPPVTPRPPTRLEQLRFRYRWYATWVRVWWRRSTGAAGRAAIRKVIDRNWAIIAVVATSALILTGRLSDPRLAALQPPDETLRALFSTAAEVLASIIGVSMAVTLVSLQMLRDTFAGYAAREVLRIREVRQTFALYVWTIFVAMISLGRITAAPHGELYQSTVLLIGLVGACLAVLGPTVYSVLTVGRARAARIEELAQAVDWKNVSLLAQSKRAPVRSVVEEIEEHPLYALGEITVRSMRERDRITPALVLAALERRLATLLDEAGRTRSDARDLFEAFLYAFWPISKAAVELRSDGAVENLARMAARIHKNAARNHLPWHNLIEFNEFLSDTIQAAAAAGMTRGVRNGVWAIEHAMEAHLRTNVPAEADVWILTPEVPLAGKKIDHDASIQWEHASQDFVRMLVRVVEAAIENGDSDVASSGLMALAHVIQTTEEIESLGMKQKHSIIRWCQWYVEDLTVRFAEKAGKVPTLALSAFSHFHAHGALGRAEPWARDTVLHLCQVLLRLAENRRVAWGELNELGTFGRGCIEFVGTNPEYDAAVVLVADTLARIGALYDPPQTSRDVEVIEELKKQLDSLERWKDKRIASREPVRDAVSRAIRSVKDIRIRSDLERLGKASWPSVAPPPPAGGVEGDVNRG